MDFKEIDLIPKGFKKLMKTLKTVSTCFVVCAVALLVIMWVAGVFHDLITGVIFSLMWLSITIPLLLPGYKFDKVSQSMVRLTPDHIHILDKKGVCWRSVNFNTITAVHVKEISGFFYGHNKDMFRNKYVCIFLNGATTIPNVPYANLFNEKDFIMFGYNSEALQWLLQHGTGTERQNGDTGDGTVC